MKRNILILVTLFVLLSSAFVGAENLRIVSLVPSVTENLFALGVGDQVVGVTDWCDYPLEATERTSVGDAFSLNIEVLLSLEPDLVIGDSNVVASYLETLQELGIEVFAIEPTNLTEVKEALLELGQVVNAEAKAQELVLEIDQRLERLLAQVQRDRAPRVFIEIWHEPLMSAGPGSFLDELVNLAGGENIAHDTDSPWSTLSEEIVIERDPEVIILTGYNLADVLARSAWQDLTALKKGTVFEVNADLYARTTPRLLDALEEMITILDDYENEK